MSTISTACANTTMRTTLTRGGWHILDIITTRQRIMTNMKETNALSGQSGSDCKLVHGDRQQQIDGNMTEQVNKTLSTDIMGNERWWIFGNFEFVVGKKTKDTRCGFHQQTNWMARTDNFIHTRTENHSEREVIHQPTENIGWWAKHFDHHGIKGTLVNLNLAAYGQKVELTISEAAAKGLQIQRVALRNQNAPIEIKRNGWKLEFKKASAKVAGPEAIAVADRAKAAPTENIAPTAEDGVHVV